MVVTDVLLSSVCPCSVSFQACSHHISEWAGRWECCSSGGRWGLLFCNIPMLGLIHPLTWKSILLPGLQNPPLLYQLAKGKLYSRPFLFLPPRQPSQTTWMTIKPSACYSLIPGMDGICLMGMSVWPCLRSSPETITRKLALGETPQTKILPASRLCSLFPFHQPSQYKSRN